ncbi:MAG: transglutaminase domain-containing protein [Sediminicola sp.]
MKKGSKICLENLTDKLFWTLNYTFKGASHKVFLLLLFPYLLSGQQETNVVTKMPALQAYQEGFTYDVMQSPSGKGVRLNNNVLLENDGPGAGVSEKGTYLEPLHKGVIVRKEFVLDNPASHRAHVVFFMTPAGGSKGTSPYYLKFNGVQILGSEPSWKEPGWRWVEIPVSLLRQGANKVELSCDAPVGKGYELLFAREDEYDDGGGKFTYQGNTAMISADQVRVERNSLPGRNSFAYFQNYGILDRDAIESFPSKNQLEGGSAQVAGTIGSKIDMMGLNPIVVGATSSKSLDGGKTFNEGKIGPDNNVAGEYTIRLNLERFKPKGVLDSPPIDLWTGLDSYAVVRPNCTVHELALDVTAYTPKGTEVIWQVRTANTNDMLSNDWGEWRTLGDGADTSFKMGAEPYRYLQWRAVLESENPLISPVVKNVEVHRTLKYDPAPVDTYYVMDAVNAPHLYSSFRISYEDALHPQLKSLQKRLNLASLLEGAQGDFEEINRLRHYVSTLWYHSSPYPEYPEWNAHAILDRNKRLGAGGMCIQFSIVFMQSLQSLGYHARHVNIFEHEVIEVYIDELGKWVLVDPESLYDSYEFNNKTGMPLNALEQHEFFLRELGFSKSNKIDWTATKAWAGNAIGVEKFPQPLNFSTFTDYVNDPENPPPLHAFAGQIRFVPRTDFLSRRTPRPLTQGMIEWPWDGYINWYDAATPRKLQYALHTDRKADLYPTLNRVEFAATYGENEGEIEIRMTTVTPNFATFEVNMDGKGWRPSPKEFKWKLRRSALNTLEMRTKNTAGRHGKQSNIKLFWHYREPFKPRESK